ncbi:MAG: hypothetical protein NDI69_16135 [Bacteriovoracaceae bacterium]|nr:hypothetical protein [Bacteriovoracaceae bacterium]
MLKNRLIRLDDPAQLSNVFLHIHQKPNKILLWQNIEEKGQRIRQNARINKVLLSQEEMILYPSEGEFNFSHHRYLYFFGFNRTTIFKSPILYHSRIKMVLRLPKEVLLDNSRLEKRKEFIQSERSIELIHHAYREHPFVLMKLLDLSSRGFSFRSSFHNVLRFKKKDRIWVRSLFDDQMLLEGEVRNVTKVQEEAYPTPYWRIGVKL